MRRPNQRHRTQQMQQLMRDHQSQPDPFAGPQIDNRIRRSPRRATAALPTHTRIRRLPIPGDQVALLAAGEPRCLDRITNHARVNHQPLGRCRQHNRGQIKPNPACRPGEIKAWGPPGILTPPPLIDRTHGAPQLRCYARGPITPARRPRIEHVDRRADRPRWRIPRRGRRARVPARRRSPRRGERRPEQGNDTHQPTRTAKHHRPTLEHPRTGADPQPGHPAPRKREQLSTAHRS